MRSFVRHIWRKNIHESGLEGLACYTAATVASWDRIPRFRDPLIRLYGMRDDSEFVISSGGHDSVDARAV